MKKVLVLQSEIDKIEEARKLLHNIIQEVDEKEIMGIKPIGVRIINVTQPMWELVNRKHKQPFWNKLYSKFVRSK